MANVTALQPIVETTQPLFAWISAMVGGIFGIYVILLIVRVYYERKKLAYLRDIRYDLDYLNQKFNLPYSTEKKPLKVRKKIMPLKKLRQEIKKINQMKKLKKRLKLNKKR